MCCVVKNGPHWQRFHSAGLTSYSHERRQSIKFVQDLWSMHITCCFTVTCARPESSVQKSVPKVITNFAVCGERRAHPCESLGARGGQFNGWGSSQGLVTPRVHDCILEVGRPMAVLPHWQEACMGPGARCRAHII